MARHNTVFAQLLKLVSRHEFEQQAKQHREGRKLRKPSRWSQFVSLMPVNWLAAVACEILIRT